jgi:CubicO group peptidase (beta-lactamase class C family)
VFHVIPTPIVARLPKTAWTVQLFSAVLAVFSLAAAPLHAQTKSPSADKRTQIEKASSSFMVANSVPGISVAVVQDGELVWSQGFGMADLENFVPATSFTLFRLGSISKPITLVSQGQSWCRTERRRPGFKLQNPRRRPDLFRGRYGPV